MPEDRSPEVIRALADAAGLPSPSYPERVPDEWITTARGLAETRQRKAAASDAALAAAREEGRREVLDVVRREWLAGVELLSKHDRVVRCLAAIMRECDALPAEERQ